MKFPLSWLKEYIDVGDLTPTKIAEILTSAGIEVDSVKYSCASSTESSCSSNDGNKDADAIFEVSLTPNLGHCASILGIARELSAAINVPIKTSRTTLQSDGSNIQQLVNVEVQDVKRCPRYACRLVKGVKVAPSPEWMQERLNACGVRPVNNIVDITNYVLLESGQPLHAFDFDKLLGSNLIVRTATPNEPFMTLDGRERTLHEEDLLICDAERPVAIAGVMGGLNSEVDEACQNVLIESAHFLPSAIRRTSKRLGLQTDASRRFERAVDPNGVLDALDRAAQYMHEIAGGHICQGVIDHKEGEVSFSELSVLCRLTRINQLLGTQLGVSEVENIFKRLDFKVTWDGQDHFELKIPTYRADIKEEIDLVEEVARVYGYDNIIASAPSYHSSLLPHAPIFIFENQVRARMLSEGLQEFLTCDLIGPSLINIVSHADMPEEATVRVLNPTSIEQSILRTSLLPGLLQVVKSNFSHQNHDLSGFEIGRIHFKDKEQYKEQSVVGVVMTGKVRPHHWKQKAENVDFYDLKGVIENLLAMMGIENPIFKSNKFTSFHPGRQLAIYVGSLEIGSLGEVHPSIVKRLDVPHRIYFAEINLHDLYKVHPVLKKKVSELPIFPSSTRDWTVTLSGGQSVEKILEILDSLTEPLLEEVLLLDIYENDSLGKGVRNVTFRFVYRDIEKTISQEAADAAHWALIGTIGHGQQ